MSTVNRKQQEQKNKKKKKNRRSLFEMDFPRRVNKNDETYLSSPPSLRQGQ